MDLRSLIKEGRLSEARAALVEGVKSSPADTGKRTLLFQVLVLLGEWDKASVHLDMISTQDPSRLKGASVYSQLIAAEKERIAVFDLKQLPSFLPEAPDFFEPYYNAVRKLLFIKRSPAGGTTPSSPVAGEDKGEGDIKAVGALFAQAEKSIPKVKGTLNGETFSGLKDTDSVLSPFLEAFIHGRYVWIPFAAIRELTVTAPRSLTDLIWIQANVTTWGGLNVGCFLPVLYPGSSSHEDEKIKLGRMTDWIALGDGYYRGAGQHVYQAGKKEIAILEIREAVFTYREK